ncbi:DUF4168 domain-containing protein [Caenispirillum bisanense]|uniref:DUF4168 domain-containing protein n=1 Tax=Caenispirillum bisanense TaxID=414052 RepID=UPI0031D369B1
MRITATALAAALIAAVPMSAAMAQSASPQAQTPEAPAVPGAPGQTADFSETQLKSFAAAVQGIQEVANEYAPRLREATEPQQLADLQEEAEGKMLEAVQDEGLSVDEYNAIALTAQSDPQVAETIRGYIVEDSQSQAQ